MNTVESYAGLYEQLGLTAKPETPAKSADQLAQDDFLALMITELTHQDPFKPMDNAQMAAQFADFATVSGIEGLNKSFESMQSALVESQAVQAAGLVGRRVVVSGNTGVLTEGGDIRAKATFDGPAANVTARVYGTNGSLVRELQLGGHSGGEMNIVWDGTDAQGAVAKPGTYRIEVQGTVGGNNVSPTLKIAAPVDSVDLNAEGGGIVLNVTGYGAMRFDQISSIA